MIRLGGYQSPASVHTRALHVAADALRPIDEVSVTENVAAGGGKAGDLLAMLADGRMDLGYFASSYLADKVPALGLLDLPFPACEREALLVLLDDRLGRLLAEAVAASTGYRVLGYWDNGARHVTNRHRPILTPADAAGMSMRTLDSPLHQRIFAAAGFAPRFIDASGLAEAVASGAVDAQENPLANTVQFGVHRHHRYLSLTGHFLGIALVLANRAWFDALTDADRATVERAVKAATVAQRGFAVAEDERCLALLRAEGVEIATPENGLDRPAFIAAVSAIAAEQLAAIDPAIRAAMA